MADEANAPTANPLANVLAALKGLADAGAAELAPVIAKVESLAAASGLTWRDLVPVVIELLRAEQAAAADPVVKAAIGVVITILGKFAPAPAPAAH